MEKAKKPKNAKKQNNEKTKHANKQTNKQIYAHTRDARGLRGLSARVGVAPTTRPSIGPRSESSPPGGGLLGSAPASFGVWSPRVFWVCSRQLWGLVSP